jgi:hypothetical protein
MRYHFTHYLKKESLKELKFLIEKLLRQYYKLVIYPLVHCYANPFGDTIALTLF